jgi:signal transduction histidine kinase/ligand-binding sensor domain-containing protein
MKHAIFYGIMLFYACAAMAQGIPFIKNYTANDYHAHNRNFDVVTTNDGSVFVANFEGLLYYNNVEWRTIYTPGITRITVVYRDNNDNVWTGGYNYFGKIQRKANGELFLQTVGKQDQFRGEVQEIWEDDNGELNFLVNDGKIYGVKEEKVFVKKEISKESMAIGLSDVIDLDKLINKGTVEILSDITQKEPLDNGLTAIVKRGQGLVITDNNGKELYTITEANGLSTNSVVYVSYDGHGKLWGATENGIFSIAIPSAFSRFTRNEGLAEEVLSIAVYNEKKYVGTIDGLFRQEGMRFVNAGIGNHSCWQLEVTPQGLLAATSNGIFCITSNGTIKQLSGMSTTSILDLGTEILSGEMDGVYAINKTTNTRKIICKLEKVSKIFKDKDGTIWLQNIYGEIWSQQNDKKGFRPFHTGHIGTIATLVESNGSAIVVDAEAEKPFPYPLFSYLDSSGVTWLTNSEGKSLYRWQGDKKLDDMTHLLQPIKTEVVQAMLVQGKEVWLGHDDGFTIVNTAVNDPAFQTQPKLLIRSIKLKNDSVIWGGYGEMPKKLPQLDSKENGISFTFSLDFMPIIGENSYRYQLNDNKWTAWTDDQDISFPNLSPGHYIIKFQGRDGFGRETEIVSIDFEIASPFYLKWYMNCLYIIIIAICIMGVIRLRLLKLEKDKQRLENIVQERTAEVVKQKNEIQEKSDSLEKALDDLHSAQKQLIRQEKMATVGKLTQGLIDRILNPLNYINNFSKLSEGLVKDIEANIEDEKENMNEDNFEDTIDVIGMLKGNLQKVGEHGVNTTRTLKAMEEMLKDRTGGVVEMDLSTVLKQDEEMLNNYYAKEITQYHIATQFDYPDTGLLINGNAEQMSKTIMSMLGNSIYAIVKKAQRKPYDAALSLNAKVADSVITLTIRDNGIGIEEKIIDKIFDPFFTTKTTGEASGIGLYLSHDVIQNYGGNISVESVKDEYSTFTITLPAITQ